MAVSKPLPGVPIDPASPWARGLVNAVVGNQAGQRVINYAPNFNGVDGAGTALRFAGSPSGGAIKTNGTTAFANFGNQPRMRGTGPVTVAFRLKLNTLTVANLPMVYSSGYDGTDLSLYIGFNANSAGNGKLWWICGGAARPYRGGSTNTDFSSSLGIYFDVLCEYNGTAYNIEVNGVQNYTNNNSGARVNNGTKVTIGSIDLNGTNSRFGDFDLEYLFHWEGRTFTAAEKAALRANPWQLWPDEPQLVFAPASGVTGTSSATLTTTGTATGAVAVAAASSQTLPLTGTSTGAVAVAGASAGTIPLTGSAAGAVAVAGASSQTVNFTGTATGAAAVAGASSGTVDLTGTATGTIPPLAVTGDSAVTIDLAGTATGSVPMAGASSGTVNTTGTAAAANPVAGASSATLAFTGSAAGTVAVAGASAVTISTSGSATGEVQNFAAVSDGTFTLAGTATGTVEVAGASAQQIELGGAAAFTIRNILGSSAGRVQTSASRTEALNSADRQNTFNPARIAAGSGKRGSNVQTGKR